ncbi:MAG: recombinase RecT [Candidatus Phlomobacter fragariae]
MNNVYTNLQSVIMQQGIAALLPAQVTPEQFTRTAATALIENEDLQKADKQSLVLALTRCAKDGLMPDGREAALVVRSTKINNQFVKKAVYMPMCD